MALESLLGKAMKETTTPQAYRLSKFLRMLACTYYEDQNAFMFKRGICRALYVALDESSLDQAYPAINRVLEAVMPSWNTGGYLPAKGWKTRALFCLFLADWLEFPENKAHNQLCLLDPLWYDTTMHKFLKEA